MNATGYKGKIRSRDELAVIAEDLRRQGSRIVFTNGCFDILHPGHIHCLTEARKQGDLLIVGLNSNECVQRLKGPSRPVIPEDARAGILASLQVIDYVVVFSEDTPIETLKAIRPHVHVKGGDYAEEDLVEAPVVREWGGRVVLVPTLPGWSTTDIVERRSQSEGLSSKKATSNVRTVVAVIPARYGSSRFSGKALADIHGKPMVQHVYERAKRAKSVHRVVIATDDRRIVDAAHEFGGEVVLTSPQCRTGTDRIAQAVREMDCDVVVNVQGDEPMIDPGAVDATIRPLLEDSAIVMGTLACPMHDDEEWHDPNAVKVVVDRDGFALYFSRSSIPRVRDADVSPTVWLKHIGLYVYRKDFLLKYAAFPSGDLEQLERLEQLRALEYGHRIRVVTHEYDSIGVDTPEDLERVRALMVE